MENESWAIFKMACISLWTRMMTKSIKTLLVWLLLFIFFWKLMQNVHNQIPIRTKAQNANSKIEVRNTRFMLQNPKSNWLIKQYINMYPSDTKLFLINMIHACFYTYKQMLYYLIKCVDLLEWIISKHITAFQIQVK